MPEATAVTVGASFRRVLRASGAALLAVLVSLCTVACGTVPAQGERHPSFARQPAADSPLARIVNDSINFGGRVEHTRVQLFDQSPPAYFQFVKDFGFVTNSYIATAGWSRLLIVPALMSKRPLTSS